jgi:hypothetical protein
MKHGGVLGGAAAIVRGTPAPSARPLTQQGVGGLAKPGTSAGGRQVGKQLSKAPPNFELVCVACLGALLAPLGEPAEPNLICGLLRHDEARPGARPQLLSEPAAAEAAGDHQCNAPAAGVARTRTRAAGHYQQRVRAGHGRALRRCPRGTGSPGGADGE